MESKNICIIGTGYVGMASAIGFAELGHRITGYDIIGERVRSLQVGITPYHEAGIEIALRKHLVADRVRFFDRLDVAMRDAEYVIVAVGTPARADGSADLSAVEAAVATAVPLLPPGATIVLRSTVPPGTTERLAAQHGVSFLYAPEFLREGSAVADFLNPDRIVVGATSPELAGGYAALLHALERPVVVTSHLDAELIKACSNAFLALKISFANEVANFCGAIGADAPSVLRGVGADRRIGRDFLAPGIGFGGPCFEKDVKSLYFLTTRHRSGNELLAATLRVNAAQPKRIVDMLEEELDSLRGTHIAVWGLAFKAGTDDVRDSLAVRIVDDLAARGAVARAFDPAVSASATADLSCAVSATALEALENADALLVLTEWPEFARISPWTIAARLRRGVVVDGRNVLDPQAIAAAGLRYRGVGRQPQAEPAVRDIAEAS